MGKKMMRMVVGDPSAPYYPSDVLSLDELSYWIAFSRVLGIGPVRFKRLLDFFHEDVAAAWQASSTALAEAGLDQKTIKSFIKQRASIVPQQELERLERLRVRIITWKDEAYPPLLRRIEYAPSVLYICGNLTDDDRHYSLGIVGTRKMSAYGRQVTEHFARELARGKVTVVSGLAMGIDTVAHTAALDAGGRTIAVLACGLDIIYPASNFNLAKRIVESGQGALLSAFPLGVQPEAGNFPARNHIISGLSLGILVAEAPQKSGALITANSALEQGREVFAVPGNIFSPGGTGVNKLIQDGAHPVTHINDILMSLNLYMVPQQVEAQVDLPTSVEEQALLALLGQEPCHIDDLIRESKLAAQDVTAALTTLELKGMVKQVGGMQYIRAVRG
ncbi:MAG TPA: DNA-processing protein DprA [Ktedonobacteraceae bacterium]|jgi:DNA processing protein